MYSIWTGAFICRVAAQFCITYVLSEPDSSNSGADVKNVEQTYY